MPRSLLFVGVVVLVLLAGCGGGAAPSDGGGTQASAGTTAVEPATAVVQTTNVQAEVRSTTTAEATRTPEQSDGLPRSDLSWATASGINVSRLFEAHASSLAEAANYTIRGNRTEVGIETDVRSVSTHVVRASRRGGQILDRDVSRAFLGGVRRGGQVETTYYQRADGGETVFRRMALLGNGTESERVDVTLDPDREFPTAYRQSTVPGIAFDVGVTVDWEFDRTFTRDGRVHYRLTADSLREGRRPSVGEDPRLESATMVVSERGVVRSMTFELRVQDPNTGPTAVRYEFETTNVNATTVEDPEWIEEVTGGRILPADHEKP